MPGKKDISADVFAAMNQSPRQTTGGGAPMQRRSTDFGRPMDYGAGSSPQQSPQQQYGGGSNIPQPPQQQFQEPQLPSEANESMILDGRTRRFAIAIPWASYCMLRPYVSPSVAAAETGRIVGRTQQIQADVLVPSVLHTLDKNALPRSLTPKAINVSSLPPDAFVAFFFVVRLLDGRTLRSFHRFSEVKEFVANMAKVLGAPLVEVGWFPWRSAHHSLVNVDARRRKLEAYLSMLFTHNQQLQAHPLTLHFFAKSGAADLEVGVTVPPPPPPPLPSSGGGSGGGSAAGKLFGADGSGGGLGGGGGEAVSGRVVVSPSKRLVTVVVDVDLSAAARDAKGCAALASELLVGKLRDATSGDDTSELRVVSLEGVAPAVVAEAMGGALEAELGTARGRALFCDEPNLQLLRALHHFDQAGEGLCTALSLGVVLGRLGVHLPPEVTSDLLMQSFVDGETSVLWHGKGKQQTQQQQQRSPPRLVDYHTFLALVLARTQPPLLSRPGDASALASSSRAASGNFNFNGAGSQAAVAVVDVSTNAPLDPRSLNLQRYSVVVMASAHAGGAVAAAGGKSSGAGGGVTMLQGGGGAMMGEGSPAFLDFKTKGERGIEVVIHKLKWPKAAAAIHKAVGIDKTALDNSAAGVGVGAGPQAQGCGCGGGGGGGGCGVGAGGGRGVTPYGNVNKPFLVAKARLIRVSDGWTKLVWFKQGFKGAVAKVGRAFTNSGLARPSEQPGAGTFDLLQVSQVRVVENPKSGLGRWFLFGKEGAEQRQAGGGGGDGGGSSREGKGASFSSSSPGGGGSASFSSGSGGGGDVPYDRYLAFVGLRESLYVEAGSKAERDWLVGGFRQLLFGAEGRARARGFAHGRALQSGHLDAQSLAAMSAASGAAAAHASHASVAAANASALAYTDDQAAAAAAEAAAGGGGGGGLGGKGGTRGSGGQALPLAPSANALYVFNLFDGDGNGVLDREEATKALVWAGFVDGGLGGLKQLESVFERFDVDGSGDLDVNEFAQLMVACEHGEAPAEVAAAATAATKAKAKAASSFSLSRSSSSSSSSSGAGAAASVAVVGDRALLESFRRLDAGGAGMLGEFEVGQWLGSMGFQLEEEQVRELMRKNDTNNDGKLSFAEFTKLAAAVQQQRSP